MSTGFVPNSSKPTTIEGIARYIIDALYLDISNLPFLLSVLGWVKDIADKKWRDHIEFRSAPSDPDLSLYHSDNGDVRFLLGMTDYDHGVGIYGIIGE